MSTVKERGRREGRPPESNSQMTFYQIPAYATAGVKTGPATAELDDLADAAFFASIENEVPARKSYVPNMEKAIAKVGPATDAEDIADMLAASLPGSYPERVGRAVVICATRFFPNLAERDAFLSLFDTLTLGRK